MTCTLRVPLEIAAVVHEIDGGGYWAEELPSKTEDEARQLAETQGTRELVDKAFPQPYDDLPPRSWVDEDE